MSLQIMTMNSGEQSKIATPVNRFSYLHCIKGSARVFSQHCGVGWRFTEGQHFVLRSGASYSIAANEPIEVALHSTEASSDVLNKTSTEEQS